MAFKHAFANSQRSAACFHRGAAGGRSESSAEKNSIEASECNFEIKILNGRLQIEAVSPDGAIVTSEIPPSRQYGNFGALVLGQTLLFENSAFRVNTGEGFIGINKVKRSANKKGAVAETSSKFSGAAGTKAFLRMLDDIKTAVDSDAS